MGEVGVEFSGLANLLFTVIRENFTQHPQAAESTIRSEAVCYLFVFPAAERGEPLAFDFWIHDSLRLEEVDLGFIDFGLFRSGFCFLPLRLVGGLFAQKRDAGGVDVIPDFIEAWDITSSTLS